MPPENLNKNNILPRKKRATLIDQEVGLRIRRQRESLRMSRDELADKVNLSRTAIQKYEAGDNRVGPSRLVGIAAALGVDVGFFFASPQDQSAENNPIEIQSIRSTLLEIMGHLSPTHQRQLLAIALTFPRSTAPAKNLLEDKENNT